MNSKFLNRKRFSHDTMYESIFETSEDVLVIPDENKCMQRSSESTFEDFRFSPKNPLKAQGTGIWIFN